MPQALYKEENLSKWRKRFESQEAAFYGLVKECDCPGFINKRLLDVIDYNISGGKRLRGAMVAWSLSAFHSDKPISDKLLDFACLVGWCVELLHAGFLVLDDIIDESPMRRGKTAWHTLQQHCGLGHVAVNDGLHLFACCKLLLHKAFPLLKDSTISAGCFIELLRLFDEVGFNTVCGQSMDILNSKQSDSNEIPLAERFSSSVYDQVTHWKTAMYTFYLPVAAGMILAGVRDQAVQSGVKQILVVLGQYFQAQDGRMVNGDRYVHFLEKPNAFFSHKCKAHGSDIRVIDDNARPNVIQLFNNWMHEDDYLDCFGNPSVTGKRSADLAEGKCTWLIVEAVKLASPEQLKTLQENYGKKETESQELVRDVFRKLDLSEVFCEYEHQMQNTVAKLIEDQFPSHPPMAEFLTDVKEFLFLRSK